MNKGIWDEKYLTILALAAFELSGAAHSALECKFNSNDTLLIMSPGTQPVITSACWYGNDTRADQ